MLNQQFDLILSIISSITLPYVLISSVFGMNLANLPIEVDFWTLMGVTMAVSVLMLVALLLARFKKFKTVGQRRSLMPGHMHSGGSSIQRADDLEQDLGLHSYH